MSYNPINPVVHMHQVPHIEAVNSGLQRVSNTFGIYDGDYWNDYTRSLLTVPIIIASLGFIALSILAIALCLRCCCKCCKCQPSDGVPDDEGRLRLLSVDASRAVFWPRLIYVFVIIAIAVDQSICFGNRDLDSALSVFDNAMSYLSNSFTLLNTDGQVLEQSGQNLLTNATAAFAAGCGAAGGIINDINTFNSDVEDFVSFVDPLPGYIDQAEDAVHDFGVDDKNYSVWELYAISFIAALLFAVGLLFKSKLLLQGNICFSMFVMLCLIILCCVEMIVLVGLADFCMDPISNTLQVMNNQTETFQTIEYYATCVGDSPFASSLDSAEYYASLFTTNVALIEQACPGNPYVTNMVSQVPIINSALSSIVNGTACPPFQQQVESVLQHGVCHSGYLGFFTIWASQYFTAFALFVLTVAASIAYQYFDWTVATDAAKTDTMQDSSSASSKTVFTHTYTDSFNYVDPVAANSQYRSHAAGTTSATSGTENINNGNSAATTVQYGQQGRGGEVEF